MKFLRRSSRNWRYLMLNKLSTDFTTEQFTGYAQAIIEEVEKAIIGKRETLRRLLAAFLSSGGHVLIEDYPGLAKTLIANSFATALGLQFKRIQFTPDLLPGDITGGYIFDNGQNTFVLRKGPLFTNILLADEINRASPKTQSALLEAMQERHVTLLGTTRPLPSPFFVLASQNPIELEGTYPLPEAQLDRFLFKLVVSGVEVDTLDEIISTRRHGEPPEPGWTTHGYQLGQVFAALDRVFLPRP